TGVCYTCGRLGHISRDFPNKKEGVTSSRPQPNPPRVQQQGKVFAMEATDVTASGSLIQGLL
ncbi:hypothetical protein PIB30_106008, partial [Stylosanthes scabra]|nr:hypothetical protein [Stylosanthes scabra]